MTIETWIGQAMAQHASDIHLRAGAPPMMRLDGHLHALDARLIAAPELLTWLQSWPPDSSPAALQGPLDFDGALVLPKAGRFRCNVMWHHIGVGVVLRPIKDEVPSLAHLECPAALADWASQDHGLILVTGPTGSGKSSTLAAMLHHIHQHQARHIITLEDPIEFVHRQGKGLVTQREVGRDTASFASGLRAALREDPDVIMVGELRDTESIRLALTAAETGHLVLATLHTHSAASSITRLVDVFEPAEKTWVQSQLSTSLLGIASQVLLRRAKAPGRVAAFEVLRATPAIGQMIRDQKINQIGHALQTGARWGMHSMAQDVQRLLAAGIIDAAQAQSHLGQRSAGP